MVSLAAALFAVVLLSAHRAAADQPEHDAPAAANKAQGDAAHTSDAHAEHDEAKPALLDWDIGGAFWSILVFVGLLVLLRFTAWKPILQSLQQREAFIADSLKQARQEREQSQKLLADYSAKLHDARAEAAAIVDEGRRDAEEVRKRVHGEAKDEAAAIVSRAKREIQAARDDAIKQMHDQAVFLATTMATKIVRKELTPSDHKRLLDESLAELSKTNN